MYTAAQSNASARPPSLGHERKWWTLAVVAAGTFMSALDGSVVNTALPVIARETGASMPTLEWVVLAYLLTAVSALLVFGRLADIYGRKRLYAGGMAVFTAGSVLCGLSPNVHALVAFRVVQALGAAGLLALGPAVLTTAFPGAERGRALGIQATVTYLGLSTGPAIGGYLTHYLGWRSVFFVNGPIGVVVVTLAFAVLQRDGRDGRQPFDVLGALTLAVGLAALLLALTEAADRGVRDPWVAGPAGAAAVALATFVAVELRQEHPVLDLRLFGNWTFAASTLAAFLSYSSTSAVNFLMPFYLVRACGYRVDAAGLMLISTSVVMAALASPAGWLSDRLGQRLPATVGLGVTVAAILALRGLPPRAAPGDVVWHLALIGVGVGLFTSPNNSAIMGSAPQERQGVAGAMVAVARNLGFGVGVATGALVYMLRLQDLSTSLPSPAAITHAMHDATTVAALFAAPGVLLSAIRGRAVH